MIPPSFPISPGTKSLAQSRFETLSIQLQWIDVAGELAQTMTREAYIKKFAEINGMFKADSKEVAETIGELIHFLRQPESNIPSKMLLALSADNSLLLSFLTKWKSGEVSNYADAAEKN